MTEQLELPCLKKLQLELHCLWVSPQDLVLLAERQQQFVCQPAVMHGQLEHFSAVFWQALASLAAAQCQTLPHDASYEWCCGACLMHQVSCLLY